MNLKDVIRRAREEGWEVELTAKNHTRFVSPAGAIVIVGTAVGRKGARHFHSIDKVSKMLERHGLVLREG